MFEKLTNFADDAIQEFNWKDIGVLKLCVLSIGVILGTTIPAKKKKPIVLLCGIVYIVTLVVFFAKMFGFECPFCKEDDFDFDDFDDFDDDYFYDNDEDDFDDMDESFVMKISAEE